MRTHLDQIAQDTSRHISGTTLPVLALKHILHLYHIVIASDRLLLFAIDFLNMALHNCLRLLQYLPPLGPNDMPKPLRIRCLNPDSPLLLLVLVTLFLLLILLTLRAILTIGSLVGVFLGNVISLLKIDTAL